MRVRNSKKFLKSGRVAAPDYKFTGEEPTWHSVADEEREHRFSKALNFYNYYLDRDDYIAIIQEYMKSSSYSKEDIDDIKHLSKTNIKVNITGKICRCFNVGMPTFSNYREIVTEHIADIVSEAKHDKLQKSLVVTKVADKPKRKSVHSIMTEKVRTLILSELDYMMDDWTDNPKDKLTKLPLASMLRGANIPVSFLGPIVQWLERHKEDYTAAFEKTCPDMVEGYSYLSKPQLRNRIKIIDGMLNEIVLYKSSKKSARKPRAKKPKSADKQISRLNYLNESKEYSMQSCDPTRIIGAQTFYMFNTKYRKATFFKAATRDGFTVQGSTLKGFDPATSFSVTLRKPMDMLPIIASKTERQINKAMSLIKTKPKPANGRINKDTILIKTL